MTKTTRSRSLLIASTALALTACASVPLPPTEELHTAELAIANAEQARGAEYASPELNEAREKLGAARNAVSEDNMVQAKRLAEQSRVDAELASAKSNLLRAQSVNDEMQKSTDILKQEMKRNSGAQ